VICIVDYGLGNLNAFTNVYRRLGIEVQRARTAAELEPATRLILPGVGAFDHAMGLLQASGMREALDELVTVRGVPVLGVCVGMQILGSRSDEGRLPGLDWVRGQVRALDVRADAPSLPLPHMGWNDVRPAPGARLFPDPQEQSRFYFLHSYYFECERAQDVAAVVDYGGEFCCAVQAGNVYGVQFHPEKSHHYGAGVLRAFAEA
jgi:glutamine amidotransferase